MIDNIIEFLQKGYSGEGYFAQEFENDVFFGIDNENNIICLKKIKEQVEETKIKTNCLELFQNIKVTLKLESGTIIDNFNVLICKQKNMENIETFVRLCLCYLADDNNSEMLNLMKNLIELFQISSNKDINYEKGLWGELFTIYYFKEEFGLDISRYWHNDFFLKYDFSLNDHDKIEVKTTSNTTRTHRVSHEQVYTNNNVLLSSVMIRKDDKGWNVLELFNEVKDLFVNDYDKITKYEKKLRQVDEENLERFEINYAYDNIKFFKVESIPKFDMDEPEGVYRTEYDIDLSNVESLSDKDIKNFLTGMFEHEED